MTDINRLSAEAIGLENHLLPLWNPEHDLDDAARFAEWALENEHIEGYGFSQGSRHHSANADEVWVNITPECVKAAALTTAILRAMGKMP